MSNRKPLYWILDYTSKLDEGEQVKCLQVNDTQPLRIILQYCFHPAAKWDLPEGKPPYKPSDYTNLDSRLYTETKRLYIFLEGTNIPKLKKESLFIELLETIHPKDAELLLSIKEKKLPYPIKPKTIQKAFPGIF